MKHKKKLILQWEKAMAFSGLLLKIFYGKYFEKVAGNL